MTIIAHSELGQTAFVDFAWRDRASCQFTGPDLFFHVGSTGDAIEGNKAAKAVCRDCEVRGACLQFALETNQENGVWGGMTEDERRKLRRSKL